MSDFKTVIIKLIKEKNITQQILADSIGITQATLSRNINGVHAPKAEIVEEIANYFGVSTDYLLGKSDIRNPESSTPSFALGGLEGDLTDEDKEMIMNLAKSLAEKNKAK